MTPLVGMSLFANIGIGEFFTEYPGSTVKVILANELMPDRARFYKMLHQNTMVVQGDITDTTIFSRIIQEAITHHVEFILATPPCQGMSLASPLRAVFDPRNTLIKYVLKAIDIIKPRYAVIENVGNMVNTDILLEHIEMNIIDYAIDRLGKMGYHTIIARVNAADYGAPQDRRRLFVLVSKDGLWKMPRPTVNRHTSLREAIGHLPSLESGQHSGMPWHFAVDLNPDHVRWMRHTPTG